MGKKRITAGGVKCIVFCWLVDDKREKAVAEQDLLDLLEQYE